HSIRRAATRATLAGSVSAAAVSRQTIVSSALRSMGAASVSASAKYFPVVATRSFSRSVAFRADEQQQQQQEVEEAAQDQRRRERKEPPSEHALFVQNYSFDVKPEDLSEAFSKYGEVVGVSMPPKRTFCFVYFKDADAVNTAAENVNGTFWHGRRIVAKPRSESKREKKPREARSSYQGPPTTTIYVGNIAFEASDADLNELFSVLKDVKDVRVAVDRSTGWPRGFAHADFASVEAATAAIETLQGHVLRGRPLRIAYAPSQKETGRGDRLKNRQRRVEQRVELEHELAEEAQKETKPEAGKQDMNWNA
ncbi:31 kDa ribonucleoprotein, chloroplastic, partial [Colletotrichum chlorophyti]